MFAGITKSNLARFVVIIVATVLLITACSQSEKVTETPAYLPKSGDEELILGGVSIDISEIIVKESKSPEYSLSLEGYLPTPCHHLRVDVLDPDEENQILFDVYSVSKPGEICAQVLEPYAVIVPFPEIPAGEYTVMVNGEEVGEISP
jgi:hypothetical protein